MGLRGYGQPYRQPGAHAEYMLNSKRMPEVSLWGELTSKFLLRMISERLKDNYFENKHLQEIWKLAYQNQEDAP